MIQALPTHVRTLATLASLLAVAGAQAPERRTLLPGELLEVDSAEAPLEIWLTAPTPTGYLLIEAWTDGGKLSGKLRTPEGNGAGKATNWGRFTLLLHSCGNGDSFVLHLSHEGEGETIRVHYHASPESEASLALLERRTEELENVQQLIHAGDLRQAIPRLELLVEHVAREVLEHRSYALFELLFRLKAPTKDLGLRRPRAVAHRALWTFVDSVYREENRTWQASLFGVADAERDVGELDTARAHLERLLSVRTRLYGGESFDVAKVCHLLGSTLRDLGELERARDVLAQASRGIRRTQGDPLLPEAIELLRARIDRQLGDTERLATVETELIPHLVGEGARSVSRGRDKLGEHGEDLRLRGFVEEALAMSERALAALAHAPWRVRFPMARFRANTLQVLGRAAEAETTLRPFLDDLESHDPDPATHLELRLTLLSLGIYAQDQDKLDEAREFYERILGDDDPPRRGKGYPETRTNLALIYESEGNYELALRLVETGLEELRTQYAENHPKVLKSKRAVAKLLQAIGRLGEARGLLEDGLAQWEILAPESRELESARTSYGLLLLELGDVTGAATELEAVLQARLDRGASELELAQAKLNLALPLRAGGQLEAAAALLRESADVYLEHLGPDHKKTLGARHNLAYVLGALGDHEGAVEILRDVVKRGENVHGLVHPDTQSSCLLLARELRALGSVAEARQLLENGIVALRRHMAPSSSLLQAAWKELARIYAESEANSRTDLGTVLDFLCLGTQRLVEQVQGGCSPRELLEIGDMAANRLAIVLSYVDRVPDTRTRETLRQKAFGLATALHGLAQRPYRLLKRARRLPQAQLERLEELRRQLRRDGAHLSRLFSGQPSSRELREAVARRDRTHRELAHILAILDADNPVIGNDHSGRIARSLERGEAAIGIWRYEHLGHGHDRYLAHAVTAAGQLRTADLGSAWRLDDLCDSWRSLLRTSAWDSDALQQVRERMRQELFEPLLALVPDCPRVFLAPDDALHLVPFDLLLDPGDPDLVRVPGLLELRDDADVWRRPVSLLVLANPDYGQLGINAHGRPPEHRGTRGLRQHLFLPLEPTEVESQLVERVFVQAFPGTQVRVLQREDATKENLLRLAPLMRVLHLATHGWFTPTALLENEDSDDDTGDAEARSQLVRRAAPSLLAGIALAGANDARHGGGILTAEELATLDLSGCELVVLSACKTGRGVRQSGQGVASLQQAVHSAGARMSLTSLWNVPVEATNDVMEEFYRRLWQLEEPAHVALRHTKETLRARGLPPRAWAGWILCGSLRTNVRRTRYELPLEPGDPVTVSGLGPSVAMGLHVQPVEGQQLRISAYARADGVPLHLQFLDGDGAVLREDDGARSLGVPFHVQPFTEEGELILRVSALEALLRPVTVELFVAECPGTLETYELVKATFDERRQLADRLRAGEAGVVRCRVMELARELLDLPGGHGHHLVAEELWQLGVLAHAVGDLETGLRCFEHVLRYRASVYPPAALDLQWARSNLSGTLVNRGEIRAALRLQELALPRLEQLLPEGDIELEYARVAHAVALRAAGHVERAEALLRGALEVYIAHFGPLHQRTHGVRVNLAETLTVAGEHEPAVSVLEHALGAMQNDPNPARTDALLLTQELLARNLFHLDELDRALELQEEVCERREQLGAQNEHHLRALGELARIEASLGRRLDHEEHLARARELAGRVVAARERTEPADSVRLALARLDLHDIEVDSGDAGKAERLWNLGYPVLAQHYPASDPRRIALEHNRAMNLIAQGRSAEAVPILRDQIGRAERTLAPDSAQTLRSKAVLATALCNVGRCEEAKALLQHVLDERIAILGEDHFATQAARQSLVDVEEVLANQAEKEK